MALPITVPYTFGNATTAIPLSNLDSDYATVYQAVNGIGNGSVALANVTITGGTVSNVSGVVPTPFTANGVVYASSTSALATGSALTFDGTNLGLGVTPSASTLGPAVQIANGAVLQSLSGGYTELLNNAIYNSGFKYISSSTATLYEQGAGAHKWYQAPSGTAGNTISFTQPMTLDVNGNLLVGQTSISQVANGFFVSPNFNSTSGNCLVYVGCSGSTNSNTTYNLYSTGAGAFRFYVGLGGTIYATSIVITAISDERLKENVRDIDTGLNSIMALKPRRFDWKEGKGQDKKDVAGFIAQEFETVFPECVSTSKAGADGIEYKNINHETLIPTLVKAIQEQQALITQLTTRLTALENK